MKAAQFAPTARNNRALEFVIVKDPKVRLAIHNLIGYRMDYLRDAPVLLIPLIDSEKINSSVQDLSIASENIMLEAAALDLGTVWKNMAPGTLSNEIMDEIYHMLNIPKRFMMINIIPLGYPKEQPKKHDEAEFDVKKIHYERF